MKSVKTASTIVFDPIPFHGGSKVATSAALKQCPNSSKFYILTATPNSWAKRLPSAHIQPLSMAAVLLTQTTGIGYWLKQFYLTVYLGLFCARVKLKNKRQPLQLVLASGHGVDMAGYWLSALFAIKITQLIHGPVGKSRLSSYAFSQGHPTFYLPSAKHSLLALNQESGLPRNCLPFVNGLDKQDWPSSREGSFDSTLQIFWAASLLKWKGLSVLDEALQLNHLDRHFRTRICYIQPKNSHQPQSSLPTTLQNCVSMPNPKNLDLIRAQSHLFISTSHQEPFGLSILEALAAGLVVIIPKDGAYWDQELEHGVNCFKYQANDPFSLNLLLGQLLVNRDKLAHVASNGQRRAQSYHAHTCYAPIVEALTALDSTACRHSNREASSALRAKS
jgi:hypothetical protein